MKSRDPTQQRLIKNLTGNWTLRRNFIVEMQTDRSFVLELKGSKIRNVKKLSGAVINFWKHKKATNESKQLDK